MKASNVEAFRIYSPQARLKTLRTIESSKLKVFRVLKVSKTEVLNPITVRGLCVCVT